MQVPGGNERPAEVHTWRSRMEGGTQRPASQLLLSSLCLDPGLAHDGSVYQLSRATVTKVSQAGGLTTADVYCLTVLGRGAQKSDMKVSAGPSPCRRSRGRCFLPALISDGCWTDLCLHGHPVFSVFLSVRLLLFL